MADNTNQQPHIDSEELEYIYSLYKSSQSGSGVKLSKEELGKLIESGKLSSIENEDKKLPKKDAVKLASFITRAMVKKFDYLFEYELGKEKWDKIDPLIKHQMLYMRFLSQYMMPPSQMKIFFINLFSN